MSFIFVRFLGFLLIAEALFSGVRVADLVPRMGSYDAVAVALILARGLLGALQFTAGWLLSTRRPQGVAIAQVAFVAGAMLTVFDVGLGLAPTSIYAWLRWYVTLWYAAYAISAALFLGKQRG